MKSWEGSLESRPSSPRITCISQPWRKIGESPRLRDKKSGRGRPGFKVTGRGTASDEKLEVRDWE